MNIYYTLSISDFVKTFHSGCLETSQRADGNYAVVFAANHEVVRSYLEPRCFVRMHLNRELLENDYYLTRVRENGHITLHTASDVTDVMQYLSSVEIYYAKNSDDLGEDSIDSVIELDMEIIPQLAELGISVKTNESALTCA
jgi:hypothetical protein